MGTVPVVKMVIPSRLTETPAVQKALLEQVKAHGFPRDAVFAVRLAVDEALNNAIRHGNANDPAREVTVEFAITDKQVKVTVADEGSGFKPDCLPDPTCSANIERPCGRGVMLMHAYMTAVRYNKAGNRVTMIKRRDCPGPKSN
ncbi:MAG: ATP-binding protein [Phycisphaeraceae bacterium]